MNYLKYILYSFVFIMSYGYCAGSPAYLLIPQIHRTDLSTFLVNTRREYFNGLHSKIAAKPKVSAKPVAVVVRRDSTTDEELFLARQIEKAKGRNRLGSALESSGGIKVSSNEKFRIFLKTLDNNHGILIPCLVF
jgi:hypothetical protein